MNNRKIYLIGFVFSLVLIFFAGKENYIDYYAKKHGKLLSVEVYDDPICGRSMNKMDIKYLEKIETVHIGKNKCNQGFYKVGDKVDVIYHKESNHFIMPYRPVNLRITITCIALLIPLSCVYKLINP